MDHNVEDPSSGIKYIVTEFVPLGDLKTLILTQKIELEEALMIKILLGIANGMAHLHACNCLHRYH